MQVMERILLETNGSRGVVSRRVLLFWCHEKADQSGEGVWRRTLGAGRQIHFAPVRGSGYAGGREQRDFQFFRGGGLREHTRVSARAGSENRGEGRKRCHRRKGIGRVEGAAEGARRRE